MRPTNKDFLPIIDNMINKMIGWRTNFLNMVGRTVLAKNIISSMPNHIMQYIKLPCRINEIINKIQREFIWGTTSRKEKNTFSVEIPCLSKKEGWFGTTKK